MSWTSDRERQKGGEKVEREGEKERERERERGERKKGLTPITGVEGGGPEGGGVMARVDGLQMKIQETKFTKINF